MTRERILFVTGHLAEHSLRNVLQQAGGGSTFDFDVEVIGVNVAAFITPKLVSRRLHLEHRYDRVILPGWCDGELDDLERQFETRFERGPFDLYDLPEYLSGKKSRKADLSRYDIEIIAEINHAPRLDDAELMRIARDYRERGADVIDVGCVPGEPSERMGEIVDRLVRDGHRVSIDSFDAAEVSAAIDAGAELVLSCNSSNVAALSGCGAEVVVIPDDPKYPETMTDVIDRLEAAGTRYRLDPILEPIGFGFAESLVRYRETRRRWPNARMMMGVGNLTELTEVDSAGVNFLLAACCQEWGIKSVLTTQVINWCRSSVQELDVARRLVRHSLTERALPKHVDSSLAMLRDPKAVRISDEELCVVANAIRDANFRVFVAEDGIHLMNRDGHWSGDDPFEVFDAMHREVGPLEPSHSFYLGYELSKAATAMTLGKTYRQDQSLSWGLLTNAEVSAVERRHRERNPMVEPDASE
ncbi:DUF6513 domain-containing protein [Stratiformator vulcanicus]|uniref:Pterin binding enzyme n=1 Tax=Stratiformator vulcanicus TaxID=2527980 RepID=A0A517R6A5_9PLAN|nr:DUF6513 domain-containing protein [Stratiformator vulcanicus]QDT39401.1 Pterin binding enzyme [Stratiformator vulcanicus]